VAGVALGAFTLAEAVERRVSGVAESTSARPRRWVFVGLAALAVVAVATLAFPTSATP
jgi:hypothetical protein